LPDGWKGEVPKISCDVIGDWFIVLIRKSRVLFRLFLIFGVGVRIENDGHQAQLHTNEELSGGWGLSLIFFLQAGLRLKLTGCRMPFSNHH
jgi:hypothetical protein